jgi:secreted trypsin-like serine protease
VAALRDVTWATRPTDSSSAGGTLIDRNSVLTAAHCPETVTAAQLRVTVGRTALNSDQGQTRRVKAIYKH